MSADTFPGFSRRPLVREETLDELNANLKEVRRP